MEKLLFQGYNATERIALLNDNADKIEERSYMKRFDSTQLSEMKTTLSEVDISINDIEEEMAIETKLFKEQLKPLREERKEILRGLKAKSKLVKEQCYKIIAHEVGAVGYYNSLGELIEEATIAPGDMQRNLFLQTKTGTDS